jgi:cytochrome c-type biogenesis protein
MGLHTMGVIRIPLLYYDTRKQMAPRHELGLFGSALMGITFSAGWSPCVGPFLGSILTLGGSTGSLGRAAALLGFYSLGLGIPFLMAALMLDRMTGPMRKLQRHMRTIELVSGALLIGIGILVFTGTIQTFSADLGRIPKFVDFAMALDDWVISIAGGQ